jgi:ATP synthase protein I
MGDDLDKRIAEAQAELKARNERPSAAERARGMSVGLRMASDFTAAVIVGGALGWGVDYLFHTTPWGLIVLLLLGFVAGVKMVVATASRSSSAGTNTAGQVGKDEGG